MSLAAPALLVPILSICMLREHPEDRIVCLDKLTYAGNLATLAEAMKNPQFRFVKADICDREAV